MNPSHEKARSAVLKTVTVAEYLRRERSADHKSVYYRGEIFAMSGGSPRHALIAANTIGEARSALKGKPCNVYTSDLRIATDPDGLYTYPDASIVCGPPQFIDDRQDTVTNPTVLTEVLSPGTEAYELGGKSDLYRGIDSVRELILIDRGRVNVRRFVRQNSGAWLLWRYDSIGDTLPIEAADIELPIAEIYRDVELDPVGGSA